MRRAIAGFVVFVVWAVNFAVPGYTWNIPVCVATSSAVCSVEDKTVPFDPANPQTVEARVSVHNASNLCLNVTLEFQVQVQQIDGFGDATNIQWQGIFGNGPGVSLPPLSGDSDRLEVTLPAGAPKGERCFRVTVSPTQIGAFPIIECIVKIVVGDVITVEEVNGNLCGLAGTIQTKTFVVTNLTGITRTVNFTATSTQSSSGTATAGDHFPLALCGQPIPPGNPADLTPPSVPGSIVLGPNQTQIVCIDTMSYPACMPGSNCHLDLAVTDMMTGCIARAGSATTVTVPGWNKDNGSPLPPNPVGIPALPIPMLFVFVGLVGGAGAFLARRRAVQPA